MFNKSMHIGIKFLLAFLVFQIMLASAVHAQPCSDAVRTLESEVFRKLRTITIHNQEEVNAQEGASVQQLMDSLVRMPCALTFPFDTLKRVMGIIDAPDNSFRIFNWSVIHTDGTYTYFAHIVSEKKDGGTRVYTLTDASDSIAEPKFYSGSKDRWFGCLYYDIVKTEAGKKVYYTLLGWDGNDLFSNRKIIEVLYFSKVGEPMFGKNIFYGYEPKIRRVILEYSQKSSMTLRYNKQKEAIIFDHLAPSKNLYSGHYNYYGSDFSFDAFSFFDGRWHYKPDIDIRNPKPLKKKK